MVMAVWDKDRTGGDDLIGTAIVSLAGLQVSAPLVTFATCSLQGTAFSRDVSTVFHCVFFAFFHCRSPQF